MNTYRTIRAMEDQDMKDLDRYEEQLAGHEPATLLIDSLAPGLYKTECYDDELSVAQVAIEEAARDDGYTEWVMFIAARLDNGLCRVTDQYTKATESEVAAWASMFRTPSK